MRLQVILFALVCSCPTLAQERPICASDGSSWADKAIPEVVEFENGHAADALGAAMGCTINISPSVSFLWGGEPIDVINHVTIADSSTPYTGKTASYLILKGNQSLAVSGSDITTHTTDHGVNLAWAASGPPTASVDSLEKFEAYANANFDTLSQGVELKSLGIKDYLAFSVATVGSDIRGTTLITDPPGAEVWINARKRATTLTFLGIQDGALDKIIFRLAGYEDCVVGPSNVLRSNDNSSATISCKLVPVQAPASP